LLTNAGHDVTLASDGEEALDLYESELPDLAILDYNMPARTGVEVIQAIRLMEPPGSRMPAVILSASVTVEARERAHKAGADEFVSKPFDAASLLQKIDVLGKRVTSPTTERPSVHRSAIVSLDEARSVRRSLASAQAADLIDAARLAELEDIARDPRFMTELLRGFKQDVEGLLINIDGCASTGDWAKLPDLMHTLKGAAVGVGAQQLALRCGDMDRAALDGGQAQIELRAAEIRNCFGATVAYLSEYVMRQHHETL
jgi:two-component system sensor histidine kinase RpfC